MVEVEREVSFEELEGQVRSVPLLQRLDDGQEVRPYEGATISLQEFNYEDLRPTTLYVLRGNLSTQERLSSALQQLGYHPLELDGALKLATRDGGTIGLLPPIVEEAPEGAVLIDGIHRNYRQRLLGRTSFVGLYIQGIHPDHPCYAYPNDWDDIIEREEVPNNPSEKKVYRVNNPYALYRDFSALNASAPRSTFA